MVSTARFAKCNHEAVSAEFVALFNHLWSLVA